MPSSFPELDEGPDKLRMRSLRLIRLAVSKQSMIRNV
jgi:hypothetical protein